MKDAGSTDVVLVNVWDAPTRVLHWTNALLILSLIVLILGYEGMEALGVAKALRKPVKGLHAYVGHALLVTLSLRIIWGFAGNRYARWADVLPFGPGRLKGAVKSLRWYLSGFKGSPARSVGHDPLASFFYAALFVVLLSQALTGVLLSGIEFDMVPGVLFTGVGAEKSLHRLKEALEEVHEVGMVFMYFFIAAHLTGLVVHEVAEKKGLFSSMIHGKKYLPPGESE